MTPRGGWGGHVHSSFPRVRFSNFSKSVEKTLGVVDFHSLRTFISFSQNIHSSISFIHSLIYSKFSRSLPHAGNSSILPRAHSKVKIINTNLRALMSDQRSDHLIKVSIERDIANKIELDSLFELFKTSGNLKLALQIKVNYFDTEK